VGSFRTALGSFDRLEASFPTPSASFRTATRELPEAHRRLPNGRSKLPNAHPKLADACSKRRTGRTSLRVQIAALAHVVVQGLREAAEDFPAPPVSADDLQTRLDRFNTAIAATVAAENRFREDHAEKDQALAEVVDGLKADLKYAEVTVRDQPEKLTRLGWGPRRSSSTLRSPGEVRDITIVSEATPGPFSAGSRPWTAAHPRSTGSSAARRGRRGRTRAPRPPPSS
jgi:hypothetical protein